LEFRYGDLHRLTISPIIHPQSWDPDGDKLTEIDIPSIVLKSGVHPLLASMLVPPAPETCLETTLSFLRYLRSGGHSVKTRKSLKSLLKSSYFTRLKMRPCLSRFRKRRRLHSNRHYLLDEQGFCSSWWGNHLERPSDYKNCIRVPFGFFCYRLEYASNFDLSYTYRYALRLLPILLQKVPPNSPAPIAADCIFNSFCTAYPQETRKAKQSITHYLSLCRPIRDMPLGTAVVHKMCVD